MKKRTLNFLISILLVISMCMYNASFIAPRVCAAPLDKYEELRDNINKAVKMLEATFDESYQDALLEVKRLIKENKWDYEMTLMSFYDNGNPYKNMDYTRLIAALSTVRELSSLDSKIFKDKMLTDVDYLTLDAETEEFEDGAKMGKITLTLKDPEYVFDFFNIDKELVFKEKSIETIYKNRVMLIDAAVYGVDLKQNTFVKTRYDSKSTALSDLILKTILTSTLSNERKSLIRTAMSLIGQVPYQWGGKASSAGYDNSWWLYLENGDQKGLDCSGFVQWAFMTAGYTGKVVDNLLSTSTTVNSFERISYDEMLPGDLGLFNNGSLSSNHVGIYLGDGYWIHCSSAANTVTITENVGFNLYVRVIDRASDEAFVKEDEELTITDDDGNVITYTPEEISEEAEEIEPTFTIGNEVEAESSDITLLAKLMHHEAGNQGFNGLVAVAEVVMNRVKSALFPNSIYEVVYQRDQFTKSSELADLEPSEEELNIARDVIEGKLSILNNENAMYFRNPTITSGISAQTPRNWGKYEYYMAVGAHAFYLQPT